MADGIGIKRIRCWRTCKGALGILWPQCKPKSADLGFLRGGLNLRPATWPENLRDRKGLVADPRDPCEGGLPLRAAPASWLGGFCLKAGVWFFRDSSRLGGVSLHPIELFSPFCLLHDHPPTSLSRNCTRPRTRKHEPSPDNVSQPVS